MTWLVNTREARWPILATLLEIEEYVLVLGVTLALVFGTIRLFG